MSFEANIEVAGIKDALKTLNRIDKSLRREITKDYKRLTQNVVDDAYQAIPLGPPVRGMARRWKVRSGAELLPWSIGVVNPDNRAEVVKIYEITDGAIATSGTYERGAHIHDPLNGLIAIGAKSATVTGPLGWLCDALATAVMVGGQESAKWFGQPELMGYRVFAVNRHEESSWEI
jgi:hypothetical protein